MPRRDLRLAQYLMPLLLGAAVLSSHSLYAQMPGMAPAEEEAKADPAKAAASAVPARAAPKTVNEKLLRVWDRFMGPESPYRGVILCIITILVLSAIYRRTTKTVEKIVRANAFSTANADAFLKTWKSVWKYGIGVLTLIALSGSLKILGLSVGFLGMMLGWSLQAPVTGIAAWIMLIVKKPFKIGDRIILAGYTGDVTDITLTHVILNQVGGSVGGEERSGRGILVPNAMLFSQVIINYTLEQKTMLDEVAVRLTYGSDYDLAEKLCIEAANEGLPQEISDGGTVPSIRCEFYDHGVLIRVRYQTIPADRQMISTAITRTLLRKFRENYPAVRFAFPHSVVRYRTDESESELPPLRDSQEAQT